jgi:hypothetical protein
LNRTIEYKICRALRSAVGILIREVRLFEATLIISLALVAICSGVALSDQSETVNLGSGPRPIYRIGYSGDGPVDIDELIEQAQKSSVAQTEGSDVGDGSPSQPLPSTDPSSLDSSAKTDEVISQNSSEEGERSLSSQIEAVKNEDEKPPYVRVPVVSDPPGAEIYIDGIFYGVTPFIATVEPESHLVEAYLGGYWNWFNIVDFSDGFRTVPIILSSKEPDPLATNETDAVQNASTSNGSQSPIEEKGSGNVAAPSDVGGDFEEETYRKLLIVVAILSFLIGSGSIATWARSRLTTSVKISFPRDGEDRWAGLIEGQSSSVRGTKRQVYVLVRYDDLHLQVKTRVVPNRDGRWSTRCDVEEGTVYRIYAVVVDQPLIEGDRLEVVPSHRAISEVGPVTGRGRAPKSAD